MNKNEMLAIVQSQLATDLNCSVDDLNGEKDSFVFAEVRDNPGRRPFPRGEQHFEMLSMGKAIVVSATPKILSIVKPLIEGKSRDEAFSMPFVYNNAIIYYIPDLGSITCLSEPSGFYFELVEQRDIPSLYQHKGFRGALGYDINHLRPDVLVALAKKDEKIVGMAGASNDCMNMWQVGIDILPEYRCHGLAVYLVNWLTLEILSRGYVPYYGTFQSNIASQRVAHRAGYCPAWICVYKSNFDEYEPMLAN